MYKKIYKQIKLILVSPSTFWKKSAGENDEKDSDVASGFVYPLLGVAALSAFIGSWWNNDIFSLPKALQLTCVDFVSGFAGFFIAAFLVDELAFSFLNIPKNIIRSRRFVGYSSTVLFIIVIISNIFPNFFFVYLFLFYTVYIVWEGADVFMNIEDKDRQKFTIATSAIVIASPMLIRKILTLILPGI